MTSSRALSRPVFASRCRTDSFRLDWSTPSDSGATSSQVAPGKAISAAVATWSSAPAKRVKNWPIIGLIIAHYTVDLGEGIGKEAGTLPIGAEDKASNEFLGPTFSGGQAPERLFARLDRKSTRLNSSHSQ